MIIYAYNFTESIVVLSHPFNPKNTYLQRHGVLHPSGPGEAVETKEVPGVSGCRHQMSSALLMGR